MRKILTPRVQPEAEAKISAHHPPPEHASEISASVDAKPQQHQNPRQQILNEISRQAKLQVLTQHPRCRKAKSQQSEIKTTP